MISDYYVRKGRAVALETRTPADIRDDRSRGNIYDRLEAARQQREKALETPRPANDDWRAAARPPLRERSFPTLKPPLPDSLDAASPHSLSWTIPWLLALAIFAVIFSFAVGSLK